MEILKRSTYTRSFLRNAKGDDQIQKKIEDSFLFTVRAGLIVTLELLII